MFKPHIQKLTRLQTSENRDIKKGVLLDRNERVENYNEATYKKILKSIIYEVKNTFGDQVPYVFEAKIDKDGAIRHSQKKEMYVSPFIDMNQNYHFSIYPPNKKIAIRIKEEGGDGDILIATQNGVYKELTDFNLLLTLITHPLMGIKVILAIHWHALRLFLKGIRFHSYTEWVSNKYGLKKGVNR